MEAHPSPFWEHSALLYAVSTRDVTPSTHGFFFLNKLYGYPAAPKTPNEIGQTLLDLAERLYGTPEAIQPGMEGVEDSVIWHQHRAVIKDSLGLCDWIYPILRRTTATAKEQEQLMTLGVDAVIGDPAAEAKLYAAATGIETDIKTMELVAAARIVSLERCLDIRDFGRSRAMDESVIDHYQWSEKTDATRLSADADEFRALLERYYAKRGWNAQGVPMPSTLQMLNIEQSPLHDQKRSGSLALTTGPEDASVGPR